MSATKTLSTDDPKALREMSVSELSPLSDTGLLLLMAYYSTTIDPPANASRRDASAEPGASASSAVH